MASEQVTRAFTVTVSIVVSLSIPAYIAVTVILTQGFSMMLNFLSHILDDVVTYAGLHPWFFIFCSLLILSPVFATSAYLNQQLAADIDKKLAVNRTRLQRLFNLCEAKENEEEAADVNKAIEADISASTDSVDT